jgi:hypothetical protein
MCNSYGYNKNLTKNIKKYISGGKSEFIANLVRNRERLFTSKFTRIIYCQPESLAHQTNECFQKIKAAFFTAELVNGLPDISKLNLDLNHLPCLLIIDDQMADFLDSAQMTSLLTIKVHHFNLTTLFTLQNAYFSSKYGRTISRNVNYKTYFYNRLDLRELRNISCQISPTSPNFMQANFDFLLQRYPSDPSHYIVIDGHHRSKMTNMHVYSHIFPDEQNEIKRIFFFPNPDYTK